MGQGASHERELERSRARLEEAQQIAHLGWWEWDVASNVVTWSDELHRICGIEPGSFEGTLEAFLARVHPEDVATTRTLVLDTVRSCGEFRLDHRIVRPDREVRTLHTRGRASRDERGVATRIMGTCWDMTDRLTAQQAVARTASLMRAVVEATADGILVVDCSGRTVAYNSRFLSLWNIPRGIAERRDDATMRRLVLEQLDDPEKFIEGVRSLYARPEAESMDVLTFRDGRVFERYSMPQRLDGEFVGRVWSFRDVTLSHRMLDRATFLADAGRLLASLEVEPALKSVAQLAVPRLAAACAIELLAGGARRLVTAAVDPSLLRALDVPPSVLSGRSVLWTDSAGSHMGVPLMARGEMLGMMIFLAGRGRGYAEEDLELVEELGRRASMAIENARLYGDARDALRVREEFLSIAAHEIRTPVTSIHLAVQGLRDKDRTSEAARKLLAIVEREDRRLSHLVDDLMDIGRIRSGRLQLELRPVDLVHVVRDVADRLAAERARSGSELSLVSDAQVVGNWDRSRLEQVVANLLSNAIKFGEGKPIRFEVRAEGGRAVLRVIDQGMGIAEQVQGRIFEPFERAVRERTFGGLGLGLYIVRTIVEALGGTVRVQSAPGAGATFTVELPMETCT